MSDEVTAPRAAILAWRYEYRFLAPDREVLDRVDIDIHLTFRKEDATPLVVGASLFAAGNTTPSGISAEGPGVYNALLPIRNFRCLPWTPHTVVGGAQKRYLLNLKLTTVPEQEGDETETIAFQGATVGFRLLNEETWTPKTALWIPQPGDAGEAALRARLMQVRAEGIDLLTTPAPQNDTFYALCDELGIAVSAQPASDDHTEDEARIRRHPCVIR